MSYDGDDARTVVVVGVPYPHLDDRMDAVQDAYDVAFGVGEDDAGWRYAVEIPTIRKTRQALGRVVRSPDDFGARILLDKRYTEAAEMEMHDYAVRGTFPPGERREMVDIGPEKLKFAMLNFYRTWTPRRTVARSLRRVEITVQLVLTLDYDYEPLEVRFNFGATVRADKQETLVSWFQREVIAVTVGQRCATRPSCRVHRRPSANATTRSSLSFRPSSILSGRTPDDVVAPNGATRFPGGVSPEFEGGGALNVVEHFVGSRCACNPPEKASPGSRTSRLTATSASSGSASPRRSTSPTSPVGRFRRRRRAPSGTVAGNTQK